MNLKKPIGIVLLMLFLVWSIYYTISLTFFRQDFLDLAILKHYGLLWLGYGFIVILLATNIVSLYAVWVRKEWSVKALYAFFLLNVLTTLFIMLLSLKNPEVSKEIYISQNKVENTEAANFMANPLVSVIMILLYAGFYALLTYYVYKKRDYLSGKISWESLVTANEVPMPNLYCTKCGEEIPKGNNFCAGCGVSVTDLLNSEKAKKKNKIKKAIMAVTLIVLVLFLIGSYGVYKRNDEGKKMLNDALKGTNTSAIENKDDVDLMRQLLEYNRTENNKMFPVCLKLDKSDLLEYSTFETKESLQSYIDDLNGCIKEYDGYEEKYDEAIKNVVNKSEEIMKSNEFSEEKRSEMKRGLESTIYNKKKRELVIKQVYALQKHYKNVLEIYKFLLANFSSYEIDYDENGELTIYFSGQKEQDEYNSRLDVFDLSRNNFISANEELSSYVDEAFKKMGSDIKLKDVQEYMQK